MTYYTIYKITNKINGKVYIGSHKTKNLNDGYMGSGKYLNHAYKKYGLENFLKEILFVFDNPNDMYAKEAEIVNDEFLSEENTYNLKRGGFGGFDYINQSVDFVSRNTLASRNGNINNKRSLTVKSLWNDGVYSYRDNKKFKEASKNTFLGKKHTDSTKKKIGEKSSQHQRGSGNSQFGTCWIFCPWLNKNAKIKKDLLPHYLDQGWCKGRRK